MTSEISGVSPQYLPRNKSTHGAQFITANPRAQSPSAADGLPQVLPPAHAPPGASKAHRILRYFGVWAAIRPDPVVVRKQLTPAMRRAELRVESASTKLTGAALTRMLNDRFKARMTRLGGYMNGWRPKMHWKAIAAMNVAQFTAMGLQLYGPVTRHERLSLGIFLPHHLLSILGLIGHSTRSTTTGRVAAQFLALRNAFLMFLTAGSVAGVIKPDNSMITKVMSNAAYAWPVTIGAVLFANGLVNTKQTRQMWQKITRQSDQRVVQEAPLPTAEQMEIVRDAHAELMLAMTEVYQQRDGHKVQVPDKPSDSTAYLTGNVASAFSEVVELTEGLTKRMPLPATGEVDASTPAQRERADLEARIRTMLLPDGGPLTENDEALVLSVADVMDLYDKVQRGGTKHTAAEIIGKFVNLAVCVGLASSPLYFLQQGNNESGFRAGVANAGLLFTLQLAAALDPFRTPTDVMDLGRMGATFTPWQTLVFGVNKAVGNLMEQSDKNMYIGSAALAAVGLTLSLAGFKGFSESLLWTGGKIHSAGQKYLVGPANVERPA